MDYEELEENVERAAENYRSLKCTIGGADAAIILEILGTDAIGMVQLEGMEQLDGVMDSTREMYPDCQAVIVNADAVLAVDALSSGPEELSQALVTMGMSAEGAFAIRLQTYWATETGLAFEVIAQPSELPFLGVLTTLQRAWRNAL